MTTIKTTFKRIICILSCCLVVVFSFILPASASNSNFLFEFNIEEPLSNEYSGYLIQPYIRKDNLTSSSCYLYFWTITPVYSEDSNTIPSVSYTYNSTTNTATLSCGTGASTGSWYFSLWTTTAGSSNIRHVLSDVVSYDSAVTYSIRPSSNTSNYWWLTPKFKGLTLADVLPTGRTETYDYLFSSDSVAYKELIKIENHFVSMLQKQDLTNSQLESLLEQFNNLLDTVYNIDFLLSEFVYTYWSQFTMYELPNQIYEITKRLDKIIEALNPKDAEELTTYSPDTFEDLNKVDESLHDMIDSDEYESLLNGGMDGYVDLNTPAYRLIWDFIESAFNTHPEVLLLVFTILSLGVAALIFNR